MKCWGEMIEGRGQKICKRIVYRNHPRNQQRTYWINHISGLVQEPVKVLAEDSLLEATLLLLVNCACMPIQSLPFVSYLFHCFPLDGEGEGMDKLAERLARLPAWHGGWLVRSHRGGRIHICRGQIKTPMRVNVWSIYSSRCVICCFSRFH